MKLVNMENLGEVNHKLVKAPYVRAVTINKALNVILYDVRFKQPNIEFIESDILHSIEHMVAVELQNMLGDKFVNFGLMGCQTGAYLTVSGDVDLSNVIAEAFANTLNLTEVPLCNELQCGRYKNHNLLGAKQVIEKFLAKKSEWVEVY
jgi:S-ribosylhomocysteine lyase